MKLKVLMVILGTSVLAACGGGGGGSGGGGDSTAPTASAGGGGSAASGSTVVLDGTGSDDSGTVTFAWTQTSGHTVTINSANAEDASFTAPNVSGTVTLAFELTVTDGAGNESTSQVSYNITGANDSPTAAASATPTTADSGATVNLNGTATDADVNDTIASYLWTQTSGPVQTIADDTAEDTTFIASNNTAADITVTFTLTVKDGSNAMATSNVVTVTIRGLVPVSGVVKYEYVPHTSATSAALDYNNTSFQPVRKATVELRNSTGTTLYATGQTDDTGAYTLNGPRNTTMRLYIVSCTKGTGAATWDVCVIDNTNGRREYSVRTGVFSSGTGVMDKDANIPSGWNGTDYTDGQRFAGPFAILDSALMAIDKVVAADSMVQLPATKFNWSENNVAGSPENISQGVISTSYYDGNTGELFILGKKNNDTDEYDRTVIIHEWNHYFEDKLSRSDSLGGSHGLVDNLDPRVAFGEGFATGLALIMAETDLYCDSFSNSQAAGGCGSAETFDGALAGWYSEESVIALMWDLVDPANDDTAVYTFKQIYDTVTSAAYKETPAFITVHNFMELFTTQNGNNGASAAAAALGINSLNRYGNGETNSAGRNTDVLPVYQQLADNSTVNNVCADDVDGDPNKLSNRRFLQYTASANGSKTFSSVGSNRPRIDVFHKGQFLDARGGTGSVSSTINVTAGQTYIIVVTDQDINTTNGVQYCFNVSAN